jgi:hypothetical protein
MPGQYRITCPYCSDAFITKCYSKHLITEHFNEIFSDKDNVKNVIEHTNTSCVSSIEVSIKDKKMFLVPCCNAFYSKDVQADKHLKNKECKESCRQKAKDLLHTIDNIKIVINAAPITITGDHNTVNNIINNTIIVDLSGNIKSISKDMTNMVDSARISSARNYRKAKRLSKALEQMKEAFKDNKDVQAYIKTIQYESDSDKSVDTIRSYYTIDELDEGEDECEKHERFNVMKECRKKDMKAINIDLSREALGLSTEENHDVKRKELEAYKIIKAEEKANYEKGQRTMRLIREKEEANAKAAMAKRMADLEAASTEVMVVDDITDEEIAFMLKKTKNYKN